MNALKNVIEKDDTRDRFAKIFASINNVNESTAVKMFEVEKFNFLTRTQDMEFTPLSGLSVFLQVVSAGLSFDAGSNHIYLMTRNVNLGTKTKPDWSKVLTYSKTNAGKIYLAVNSGYVESITNPVIIYDCDEYKRTNENGVDSLFHVQEIDRPANAKIVAGYCYKLHKNGLKELIMMGMSDVARLKNYSAIQNGVYDKTLKKKVPGKPNALYTSNDGQIDEGFFEAKIVKKALKNIPLKKIVGTNEVDEEGNIDKYKELDWRH